MNVEQFRTVFNGLDLKHQKRTFEKMQSKEDFIGSLKGKNPKLTSDQVEELKELYDHCEELSNGYYTKRVFKNGDPARIVEEDLTRKEAQERVKLDQEENPDCEYYMLVFDRQ
jgi:hypothetical protein